MTVLVVLHCVCCEWSLSVCVWIGALVCQSVWYVVCGSKVWRFSEVNKQQYCQSASHCLLSSLLSYLSTKNFLYSILFPSFAVVFCFAWTDKKLECFSLAAESFLQHVEWGKLIRVWVYECLCVDVTLMQTKNLNCNDADLRENEPGKTWWPWFWFISCFVLEY